VELEEIRASGLLELYVMDQLSPAEKAEVESHLLTYPELHKELREIERSLEIFARSASMKSPAGVKERIIDSIRHDGKGGGTKGGSNGFWSILSLLGGLGLLVFGYLYYQKDQDAQRLTNEIALVRDTCQTRNDELTRELELLRQLTQSNNTIIPFQATPGFASTDLYLHINNVTKRNFIQVRNLPPIAANQSYELWSLRPNQPPAPLNVFDAPASGLIEVTYVEGTEVYAITIEQRGGVNSPTMANLIGTVSVTGI
jgi:hypothetical protein